MSDLSISAPATITITHPGGSDTITITVPTTPPVKPVGKQQYSVAVAGTGDWIIRADAMRLDINAPGTIFYASQVIPGSTGSYAVGYDPGTNSTYKQASATAPWLYWGGSMTDATDWHTPATPWTPPAAPPVTPPGGTDLRSRMIAWIKGLAGSKVMIGQYCDSATVGLADADAFTRVTGKHVAMIGDGYWPFWPTKADAGGSGRSVAQVNADAIAEWQQGGLPYIQSSFPSPTGGDMYGICDPVQVTTPGTAQWNKLHGFYDQEVAGLLALKAAGLVFPYRCYFENKWNFWWGFGGSSGWTAPLWIKLWQQHYDYLLSKGCDHLIWILSQYRPDSWPGDKYVDLHGEDVYSDQSTQYKSLKDAENAAHPNHPWGMMEWGSGSPSQGNPNFDMRSLIADIKGQMKGTVIVQAWCGSKQPYAWRLANMQHLTQAMADPIVLLRENLNRPT